MLRVVELRKKGCWSGPAADTVVLGFDDRHRRRVMLTGCNGLEVMLDMARAVVLGDGDGLVLEDGRVMAVRAAAEPLLKITCDDPLRLARVAWHLGNRHLATQIETGHLLIRADHVIADMVRGLGTMVETVEGPFDPEGGAYESASHGHHHHRDDGHHGHG